MNQIKIDMSITKNSLNKIMASSLDVKWIRRETKPLEESKINEKINAILAEEDPSKLNELCIELQKILPDKIVPHNIRLKHANTAVLGAGYALPKDSYDSPELKRLGRELGTNYIGIHEKPKDPSVGIEIIEDPCNRLAPDINWNDSITGDFEFFLSYIFLCRKPGFLIP